MVDARLTATQFTSYKYDGMGNLQALQYPSGVTNLYQYDSLNRLTNFNWKLNSAPLASFVYQLGLAGNRTNLSETVNNISRTYAWKYDNLYRLTNETVGVTAPTGTLGYGYDDVGNRTNRTGTLGSLEAQTLTYNTNDWLGTDKYDSNGNTVTNVSSQGYLYDYENRLTNFNNGAVVLVYDADGNRLKKTTASTTNLYLVARVNLTGYPQVVEEFTVSGGATNLARAYTYGLALISQRLPAISTNFFGSDGHGSTRFLLNPAGSITDTNVYDAFGTLISSPGITANNYLYSGEQYDPDLGLYYLRARYFNAGTGRFWTMDRYEGVQENPLSLHKYTYCHDDSIYNIDPLGLKTYLYLIGEDATHLPLTKAATYLSQHLSITNGDKIIIKNIHGFNDFNEALTRNADIAQINYIGHGGPGILFIGIGRDPDTNISGRGGEHSIRGIIFASRSVNDLYTGNVRQDAEIFLYCCYSAMPGWNYDAINESFRQHFDVKVHGGIFGTKFRANGEPYSFGGYPQAIPVDTMFGAQFNDGWVF